MTNIAHCLMCASPLPAPGTRCPTCGHIPIEEALPDGTPLNGGRYVIEAMIGQGSFGIAYRAKDCRFAGTVAVKEFFPTGSSRQGKDVDYRGKQDLASMRQRFIEESELLERIQHPGIVALLDRFDEHATHYIVMEYLEGESLSDLIAHKGPLDPALVTKIANQLLEALDVVHQHQVLHRDIKPENVMLTKDGRAVLIDFGTARNVTLGKTMELDRELSLCYAAPEQLQTKARFDCYTDFYALAATLHHALSGQMPPSAPDRIQGVPLATLPNAIPKGLRQAVLTSLELYVDKRPQNVNDFFTLMGTKRAPRAPARVAIKPGEDLARAIARVASGGVVELGAGDFVLPLGIDISKAVTLRGKGAGRTHLRVLSGSFGLRFQHRGKLVLEGIWLQFEAPAQIANVLEVLAGELELRTCRVGGGRVDAQGAGGHGVYVTMQARATLMHVVLSTNEGSGLYADGEARIRIDATEACDNAVDGITLVGKASAELYGLRALRNGEDGVSLRGDVQAVIRGGDTAENGSGGVRWFERAGGSLEAVKIWGNRGDGVAANDSTAPVVTGNQVTRNGGCGVAVFDAACPVVRSNTVLDNDQAAIAWEPSSAPKVEGNTCGKHPWGELLAWV